MEENNQCLVICLKKPGQYALATRIVFENKIYAEEYAKSIDWTRYPIVVESPLPILWDITRKED